MPLRCRIAGALTTLSIIAGLSNSIAVDAADSSRTTSVKVCSAYGNGCLIAPIRKGSWGLEARLPSGTWIDCKGDCRETVRQDLLDFWETQSDKARILH